DWVVEIDRQLRASTFFVVFLSEDSIRSDMVRQEVQIAHELRQEGKMAIFPVRLGFLGKLPYDLASFLSRIQYVVWKPEDSAEILFALLHAAITGGAALPVVPSLEDPAAVVLTALPVETEGGDVPLPAADSRIIMETGSIRLDSPFYVK